MPHAVTE